MLRAVSKSTAFSSAVSGDGALSSGSNAGGADREGGEAAEARDGAAAGRLVLPGDDAFAGDVVVGPAVDGEGVTALGHAQVIGAPAVVRVAAGRIGERETDDHPGAELEVSRIVAHGVV